MASKRPRFTRDEISAQLNLLTSYGDFLPTSPASGSEGVEHLAPIIRNSIASRQQETYLRQLTEIVKAKETEIEEVCRANYQDFVTSTEKLLRVRQGTVSLKHRVSELNEDIQAKGGDIAEKKRDMLEARRVGQNIDDTIDTLQACLRVLDLSDKVGKLIEQRKHYAALRVLDDLESNQLKQVLHFPFAAHMLARLASTRQQIRDAVTREMKTWLFEAREASRTVGKLAFEAMEQRNRRWRARKARDVDGTLRLARINGPVELATNNVVDNEHVRIDFKPLHQCIHIYDTLDAREELQASYQDDRRAQANLLLSQTAGLRTTTPQGRSVSVTVLESLLQQIVGFFVIEARVRQITNGFRTDTVVDDLWEDVVERTVSIVNGALESCGDVEAFLAAKAKLLVFVQALDTYGFVTGELHAILQHLSEVFLKLLERKFGTDFEQIINEDDYQAMVVNDVEEFEKVVSVSWLPAEGAWSENELRRRPFPLALPFSQTYPLSCIDIRNFVDQYYQFADGLQQHHRDVDDILRRSLDSLLVNRISATVNARVLASTNLTQLAQIVVNLLFFETACSELEALLVHLRAANRGGTVRLDAVTSFRTTLEAAHTGIVTTVGKKLNDCFELADYHWASKPMPSLSTSSVRSGDDQRPSEYLSEMADYLTNLVHSVLYQLPANVRIAVYRGALEHIADTMTGWLTEPEPKQISETGLARFATDVRFITRHAAESLPDGGTDDVFEELSQMVSLLQSENIADFLDPDIRDLAYPRIASRNLSFVLVKMVTYLNDSPSTLLGPPTDHRRKAQLEEVLKAISRV